MKTVREVIRYTLSGEIGVDDDCEDWIADSILSALKEAGYVCVPVEATDAMLDKGADYAFDYHDIHGAWKAMIAASQDQGRG